MYSRIGNAEEWVKMDDIIRFSEQYNEFWWLKYYFMSVNILYNERKTMLYERQNYAFFGEK